jgi:hypothetical protein
MNKRRRQAKRRPLRQSYSARHDLQATGEHANVERANVAAQDGFLVDRISDNTFIDSHLDYSSRWVKFKTGLRVANGDKGFSPMGLAIVMIVVGTLPLIGGVVLAAMGKASGWAFGSGLVCVVLGFVLVFREQTRRPPGSEADATVGTGRDGQDAASIPEIHRTVAFEIAAKDLLQTTILPPSQRRSVRSESMDLADASEDPGSGAIQV